MYFRKLTIEILHGIWHYIQNLVYQWPIQRTSNPYIQEQKHYRKPFWKLQSNMRPPPHDTLNSPINDISCYFYLCHFWCKVTILVKSLHEDSGEDGILDPHYVHLDQTIKVAPNNYSHIDFPPTLIGPHRLWYLESHTIWKYAMR